jgi:hypothetical protein
MLLSQNGSYICELANKKINTIQPIECKLARKFVITHSYWRAGKLQRGIEIFTRRLSDGPFMPRGGSLAAIRTSRAHHRRPGICHLWVRVFMRSPMCVFVREAISSSAASRVACQSINTRTQQHANGRECKNGPSPRAARGWCRKFTILGPDVREAHRHLVLMRYIYVHCDSHLLIMIILQA